MIDETEADRAAIRQANLFDEMMDQGAGPLVANE